MPLDKEVYIIFCLTAVAGNQAESVYCKTYNISGLSLVLQEQGIHITFNLLNRQYLRSSDFTESYSLKQNVSFLHPLTFVMMGK